MKKQIIALIFFLFFTTIAQSQTLQLTAIADYCYNPADTVKQTVNEEMKPLPNGNGYVVINNTTKQYTSGVLHHGTPNGSVWNMDAYIAVLDKEFNVVKANTYGGSLLNDRGDAITKIFPQSDGTFLCVGECTTTDGDVNNTTGYIGLWVFKVDSNLQVLWSHPYTCTPNGIVNMDAVQTKDGGLLILNLNLSNCGDANQDIDGSVWKNDFLVYKCDSNGTKLWAKVFGSSTSDDYGRIAEDKAGNIYLAYSGLESDNIFISDDTTWRGGQNTQGDTYVMKLDSAGNRLWTKSYGGTLDDGLHTMFYDSLHNEIIVTGFTRSQDILFAGVPQGLYNPNNANVFFIRMDTAGVVLQKKVIAGNFIQYVRNVSLGPLHNTYFLSIATQSRDSIGSDFYGYVQTGYQANIDLFLCLINQQNNYVMKYGIHN